MKKRRTIINQYDYMRLVQELAYKMYQTVVENNEDRRHEYEDGEFLTEKGEDVLAGFEEDVTNIINFELQLEFHGKDDEWRTKEPFIDRIPF